MFISELDSLCVYVQVYVQVYVYVQVLTNPTDAK